MAKAKPVTEQPEDPATNSTTEEVAVAPTPEVPEGTDPLARFKSEREGLTIYNFIELAP